MSGYWSYQVTEYYHCIQDLTLLDNLKRNQQLSDFYCKNNIEVKILRNLLCHGILEYIWSMQII